MMQERKQKGKILVFSSREICYLSSNFFANQIGAAFEELGYEVTVCELSKEDDLDAKLARYIGQPYRLILDFNSLLPRMVLDDGTPYVDRLAGPFFDYILDHPLFHYQGLSSGYHNLEFTRAGVTKGNGLTLLCSHLGVDIEETLACGDTQNDIDILKTAAIGVAMENALPEVKEIADFVTRSNENSGVAHAIHTFAL